jgi:xanthine dehydrogenase accessory factor
VSEVKKMRDIYDALKNWLREDEPLAIATVVTTWGSSPRSVGSKMAVRADGAMLGSVSGGCVESAVAETALQIIQGASPQLLEFGVADDTAWEVGLACGGSIEVFVQALNPEIFSRAGKVIESDQSFVIIYCIAGPDEDIGKQALIDADAELLSGDEEIISDIPITQLQAALGRGESHRLKTGHPSERELFFDLISAPARLVLIGGVHISIALAEIAKLMDYKTILIDPRRLFASQERFPAVDELIRMWPQEAYEQIGLDQDTAVAILTHDPKIDDPAVLGALQHNVSYVGVLGSQKTHAERLKRLRKAGCSDAELAKLHAPIGLDLGAQSPEEIALSIMAEITAARRNKLAT